MNISADIFRFLPEDVGANVLAVVLDTDTVASRNTALGHHNVHSMYYATRRLCRICTFYSLSTVRSLVVMLFSENVYLFNSVHERNRQTDGQTDRITMTILRFALKCISR